MQKIILSFLFVIISFVSNAQRDSINAFPNMNVNDLYGKTTSTSTFINGTGGPILLVFWISTYKVPSKELDAIEEIYDDWKKEFNIRVIVISVDDSRTVSRVMPMVNAKGWSFEFYIDENSDFKRAMNVNSLPHTFVISKNGEIMWQKVGYLDGEENFIYEELLKLNENRR